jgi:hypothetical protein
MLGICTTGTASRVAEAGRQLLAEVGLAGQVLQLAADFEGVTTAPH